MQAFIGYTILAIILLIAWFGTIAATKGMRGERTPLYQIAFVVFMFIAIVCLCYLVLGCIGGILWVIAWIGILIRDILQWLIEAVLYPLLQLIR